MFSVSLSSLRVFSHAVYLSCVSSCYSCEYWTQFLPALWVYWHNLSKGAFSVWPLSLNKSESVLEARISPWKWLFYIKYFKMFRVWSSISATLWIKEGHNAQANEKSRVHLLQSILQRATEGLQKMVKETEQQWRKMKKKWAQRLMILDAVKLNTSD